MIDDGYIDDAVEKLNGHTPAGTLRGGKYSAFDGGTCVPMIVSWPGHIAKGTSAAPFSQVDMMASFAQLMGKPFTGGKYMDSENAMDVLLGKNTQGRNYVIQQSVNNTLSIIKGDWKYIEPSNGPAINKYTNTELGNNPKPQLYNLKTGINERKNLADANPGKLNELRDLLNRVRGGCQAVENSPRLRFASWPLFAARKEGRSCCVRVADGFQNHRYQVSPSFRAAKSGWSSEATIG